MIHVLVSFDANYMQHTQVMLYSLCKHTKESVEVWLLNLKLTDEQCAACKRFIERKCGAELKIIDMDLQCFVVCLLVAFQLSAIQELWR